MSFCNNIGLFTGQERAGYILSENQSGLSYIFPGSALSSQNLMPQYVVYEKILKTSHQFLLQVMPVKSEWIQEAVSTGKLPLDPAERFREYTVSTVSITHVGWQVFKKAYIDNNRTKEKLKEICQNTLHSVDASATKASGIVRVYSHSKYHDQARSFLENRFDEIRVELRKEQLELGVTEDNNDVQLVIGHGGQIQYVLMPGDSLTVVIKGPLDTEWTTGVMEELTSIGNICSISSKSFNKDHRIYVKFYDPKTAADVVTMFCERHDVVDDDIIVEILNKKYTCSQSLTTLKVEWCRRERKNYAFIDFKDPADAAYLLRCREAAGYRFRPDNTTDTNVRSYKVFVLNIPNTHIEDDLRNTINSLLSVETDVRRSVYKVQFGYEKKFSTSSEKLLYLRHQLKLCIDKCTHKYSIDIPQPKDYFKTYRAYIHITDAAESDKILSGLAEEEIDGHPLQVSPQLSSVVVFSNRVFAAIRKNVERVEAALSNVIRTS